MTAPIDVLRQNIRVKSGKSTSSRNALLTRQHVALSVADQSLREKLLACTSRKPCNQPCCPQCAEQRGKRYYNYTLKPAIAQITNPCSFYWITINVCRSADLETGNKAFAGKEHAALKHIVEQINAGIVEAFQLNRLQIWATREVEPEIQADGSFQWMFHWHLIAHADGCHLALAKALKARWNDPRAVHAKRIDTSQPEAFTRSLKALAGYGTKGRYTVATTSNTATNRREWLPQTALNDLAEFKQSHRSKWSHFTLGMPPRNRP